MESELGSSKWAYGKAESRNPEPETETEPKQLLYLFIVIIFFTVAFFAYGAKFFFENFIYAWALQLGIMIDMSTPPPFATFPSQWMKHGALLRNE